MHHLGNELHEVDPFAEGVLAEVLDHPCVGALFLLFRKATSLVIDQKQNGIVGQLE